MSRPVDQRLSLEHRTGEANGVHPGAVRPLLPMLLPAGGLRFRSLHGGAPGPLRRRARVAVHD